MVQLFQRPFLLSSKAITNAASLSKEGSVIKLHFICVQIQKQLERQTATSNIYIASTEMVESSSIILNVSVSCVSLNFLELHLMIIFFLSDKKNGDFTTVSTAELIQPQKVELDSVLLHTPLINLSAQL